MKWQVSWVIKLIGFFFFLEMNQRWIAWRQLWGLGGVWELSCHSLGSRRRVRGFSSAPWLWAVRAVTESPAVGAAVPAGCWFRCALSPAAVSPRPPLLHPSSYPKESWQSCGHPGKCQPSVWVSDTWRWGDVLVDSVLSTRRVRRQALLTVKDTWGCVRLKHSPFSEARPADN